MTTIKPTPTTNCRCGRPVGRDDVTVTAGGAYAICGECWDHGRRRWFRPDSKAERIAAVERSTAATA